MKSRKEVKALVPAGFGLNCDYETAYALRLAGAVPHSVHLNKIFSEPRMIHDYQLIVWIGGFSMGDFFGAGQVLANRINDSLSQEILKFIHDAKPMIGICNGYQVLVKAGFLPGFDGDYMQRNMSVTYNDCGNFYDGWVDLKVNQDSPCIWTRGIEYTKAPVRHGEGKVVTLNQGLRDRLKTQNQIVLQYCLKGTQELAQGKFPDNTNGSADDIAGICDPTGRIFGLMPHPEAFNDMTNDPGYSLWAEQFRMKGLPVPQKEGGGVQVFRNAVNYCLENLLG